MIMEYTIITDKDGTEHILIDRGNDEFTSMPKAVWDELQAKQTEGGLI